MNEMAIDLVLGALGPYVRVLVNTEGQCLCIEIRYEFILLGKDAILASFVHYHIEIWYIDTNQLTEILQLPLQLWGKVKVKFC